MLNKNNIDDEVRKVCSTAKEAGCQVRKVVDKTFAEAKETANEVEGKIKQNPVKASLIAAGVGFLLGTIFSSRKI